MSMNDLLSDTLTRIRNAYSARQVKVVTKNSKLIRNVLTTLYEEGYISGYYHDVAHDSITVTLKYTNDQPSIRHISRISKPGNRVYISSKEILPLTKNYTLKSGNLRKNIADNYSLFILTTSHGVMSHKEALLKNIGGEVLCKVL